MEILSDKFRNAATVLNSDLENKEFLPFLAHPFLFLLLSTFFYTKLFGNVRQSVNSAELI